MIISERKLRSIVRELIGESLSSGSGSGEGGPVTSSIKKGGGGYEYEIFSDGKVQIVKKGDKKYTTPVVLNQTQAVAVAKEQIKMGNKGQVVARIASGDLVYDQASSGAPAPAPAPAPDQKESPATGTGSGIVLVGRQDFFPLDKTLGLTDKSKKPGVIGKIIGQGHAFAIVVDPKTKVGYRYEFGRYKQAQSCADDRWGTQVGNTLFGKETFNDMGFHTMGVTLRTVGSIPAKISPDGKQILNLPQFLKSVKKPDDYPGNVAIITVSNPAGSKAFGESNVMKCHPYALPGFGWTTTRDTMNCGIFVARLLAAGSPNPPFALDEGTLLDRPDVMYEYAASSGYQTSAF